MMPAFEAALDMAGLVAKRSHKIDSFCNLTLTEQSVLNNTNPREELMKILALILLASMALSAVAADTTTVKGHLVDISCASEEGHKPDFGANHSRNCLLMDECVKSGYGVLTEDKKIVRFDQAGNAAASKFISTLKKDKDIKVAVTGTVSGETMTVSKIELQ